MRRLFRAHLSLRPSQGDVPRITADFEHSAQASERLDWRSSGIGTKVPAFIFHRALYRSVLHYG